jgi:hypothetical protein
MDLKIMAGKEKKMHHLQEDAGVPPKAHLFCQFGGANVHLSAPAPPCTAVPAAALIANYLKQRNKNQT